jgi:hypothetical protein
VLCYEKLCEAFLSKDPSHDNCFVIVVINFCRVRLAKTQTLASAPSLHYCTRVSFWHQAGIWPDACLDAEAADG